VVRKSVAEQSPVVADAVDHRKRLKGNEDDMGVLAQRALDTFLEPGEGEFIKGFAGPFTLLVIADLLGLPDGDRDDFVQNLHHNVGGGLGSTEGESLAHSPLEFVYGRFAAYIEDRRRQPRDDVLTGPRPRRSRMDRLPM
jgi:cytochrome P450 family 150 subfamily A5